jgi:hypothetical protein
MQTGALSSLLRAHAGEVASGCPMMSLSHGWVTPAAPQWGCPPNSRNGNRGLDRVFVWLLCDYAGSAFQ